MRITYSVLMLMNTSLITIPTGSDRRLHDLEAMAGIRHAPLYRSYAMVWILEYTTLLPYFKRYIRAPFVRPQNFELK
jgi:hypothetical protein